MSIASIFRKRKTPEDFEDAKYTEALGQCLTLGDISNQLTEKGVYGVVYVWVESPMYGAIYIFGNHDNENWHLYCKTPEYA